MKTNFENILKLYKLLMSGSSNSFEVYAGEQAQSLAAEKGIPEEKWLADRTEMQFGQEIIANEFSRGIPNTDTELEQRVREMLSRMLDAQLRSQPNDIARKGLVVQTLLSAGEIDEDNLSAVSQRDLPYLKNRLVNTIYNYATDVVLPAMQHQCDLLKLDIKSEEPIGPSNAGAYAVASYLETPELQSVPEVVGAVGEIVCTPTHSISAEDFFAWLSVALISLAAILAFLGLLTLSAGIISTAGSFILVEGTTAGVGAAIVADITAISGFVINMLLAAIGPAVLGGLSYLTTFLIRKHNGTEEHINEYEDDEEYEDEYEGEDEDEFEGPSPYIPS